MLYVFKGKQVIAEVKGTPKAPVIEIAYWASNDQDLSQDEMVAFFTECAEEIKDAAHDYHNVRVAAGDRRDY